MTLQPASELPRSGSTPNRPTPRSCIFASSLKQRRFFSRAKIPAPPGHRAPVALAVTARAVQPATRRTLVVMAGDVTAPTPYVAAPAAAPAAAGGAPISGPRDDSSSSAHATSSAPAPSEPALQVIVLVSQGLLCHFPTWLHLLLLCSVARLHCVTSVGFSALGILF